MTRKQNRRRPRHCCGAGIVRIDTVSTRGGRSRRTKKTETTSPSAPGAAYVFVLFFDAVCSDDDGAPPEKMARRSEIEMLQSSAANVSFRETSGVRVSSSVAPRQARRDGEKFKAKADAARDYLRHSRLLEAKPCSPTHDIIILKTRAYLFC